MFSEVFDPSSFLFVVILVLSVLGMVTSGLVQNVFFALVGAVVVLMAHLAFQIGFIGGGAVLTYPLKQQIV